MWCALVLLTTGCMVSPYDGQRFATTSTAVPFNGWHLMADSGVTLEAFNPATGAFEPFASARSSSTVDTAASTVMDDDLYKWETSQVVPARFWTPGAVRGSRARVKATTMAGSMRFNLTSVERNWGACAGSVDGVGGFARECQSDHNPEAWILTSDYCNEGPLPQFGFHEPRASFSLTCNDFSISVSGLSVSYPNPEMRFAWRGREEVRTNCRMVVGDRGGYAQCWGLVGAGRFFRNRAEIFEAARAGDLMVSFRARTGAGTSCEAPSAWTSLPVSINTSYFRGCPTPPPDPEPEPEPMPTPAMGPDLVVRIASQDGFWAPTSVCNQGRTSVMTNRFFMSVRGSAMASTNEVSMESYLPLGGLAPGQCWSVGDVYIAGWGGAGGSAIPSSSVTMCIDTRGQIAEGDEFNNCSTR
ncbi:MAG: hypothetical protein DI536_02270 [Archangium gephyra]|uniref:Uncharacterized protein n=1 Tax=Archangium gephyra TaxID=48 RepID=A0A2W5VT38_9BACT|nr:MAG: hypothetical protein DI536_02270 [Archangium gephyra]